ncbi:MAG: TIGR03621 family F420-dependent LLM class oxidoreductase [Microthrixaceae bacterium]
MTGTARPFRFAAQLNEALHGLSWADTCREIEDLGYSTVFVPDHFDEGLGPISAMATAAAATTELNVGALVLDCDFRHPAVTGRELATIDALSEGRLEVGLGAGWKRSDYDSSGIPMDRPGVRVSRMIEHATILRALFTEGSVTFEGEHYQVRDLLGEPRPHTAGGPPFLIGGGAPRLLRFAGGFADIVGVNPSIHSGEIDADAAQDGMPERIDEKFGWVTEGAADRRDGKGRDDIEFNAWLAAAEITDDRDGVGALLGELFGVEPGTGLDSPMVLVGNTTQVSEDLQRRRERWGYSYTVIPGDKARDFAPVVADLAGT